MYAVSDDYYTSVLAWSAADQLAVALQNDVHLWSAGHGQRHIPGHYTDPVTGMHKRRATVTAVAYSYSNKWIAIARKDGLLQIMSRGSNIQSAEVQLVGDIGCLAFRPIMYDRAVSREYLILGSNNGYIHYFSISVRLSRNENKVTHCRTVQVITTTGHSDKVTSARRKDHSHYTTNGAED